MSAHTNDVVVRTILLPAVFLGVLSFGAHYGVSQFNTKHAIKTKIYQGHQSRLQAIKTTKAEIEPLAKKFPEWRALASTDTRAGMDTNIRRLKNELNPKKIMLTEFRDDNTPIFGPNKKLPLGTRTYTEKWEGTWKELQRMLIRQEERRPYLHLISLGLRPSNTGLLEGQTLALDATFAAWEGGFKINNTYIGDKISKRDSETEENPQTPSE
jgi:hypothetical protein